MSVQWHRAARVRVPRLVVIACVLAAACTSAHRRSGDDPDGSTTRRDGSVTPIDGSVVPPDAMTFPCSVDAPICCYGGMGLPPACMDGLWVCPPGTSPRPAGSWCEGIDGGPGVDWWTCMVTSECTVMPASCCGSCGAAVPGDMVGVSVYSVDAQRAEACGTGPVACPGCFIQQSPALVATCTSAYRCEAFDIRTHPVSACASDAECILTTPSCCPDCSASSLDQVVAINASQRGVLSSLLCDDGMGACPPCEPTFPSHFVPYCGPDGHCAVTIVGP